MADLGALTEKQRRVAELLAAGYTRQEAAKRTGVSERSVYRWLDDAAFQRHIRAEQNRLRGELVSASRRSLFKSIRVLEAALDSTDENSRILAARALLGAGARFLALVEMAELSDRVEKIERRFEGVGYELN
jgi:transposase-like protein